MIEFILIIAFSVLFIHSCTWEGMILESVVKVFWKAPVWIKKPLFECPICMTPWWGSLIIVLSCINSGVWIDWFSWIIIIITAGGINSVLDKFINDGRDSNTTSNN